MGGSARLAPRIHLARGFVLHVLVEASKGPDVVPLRLQKVLRCGACARLGRIIVCPSSSHWRGWRSEEIAGQFVDVGASLVGNDGFDGRSTPDLHTSEKEWLLNIGSGWLSSCGCSTHVGFCSGLLPHRVRSLRTAAPPWKMLKPTPRRWNGWCGTDMHLDGRGQDMASFFIWSGIVIATYRSNAHDPDRETASIGGVPRSGG